MRRSSGDLPPFIPPGAQVFEMELNPMQAQLMKALLNEVFARHELRGGYHVSMCDNGSDTTTQRSSKLPAGSSGSTTAMPNRSSSGGGSSSSDSASKSGTTSRTGLFPAPGSSSSSRGPSEQPNCSSSNSSSSAEHGAVCPCCGTSDEYVDAGFALAEVVFSKQVSSRTVDKIKPYLLAHISAAALATGTTSGRKNKQRVSDLLKRLKQELTSRLADVSQQLPNGLPAAAKQQCQLIRTAVERAFAAALEQQQQLLPIDLNYILLAAEQLAKVAYMQSIVWSMGIGPDHERFVEETNKLGKMLNVIKSDMGYMQEVSNVGPGAAAVNSPTAAATPPSAAAAAGSAAWGSDKSLAGLKGLFQRGSSSGSSSTYSKIVISGARNPEAAAAAAATAAAAASKTVKGRSTSVGAVPAASAAGAAAAAKPAPASAAVKKGFLAAPVSKWDVERKFRSPNLYSLPDSVEATPAELAAIRKHKIHMADACANEAGEPMWSVLHYAISGGKVKLVQQLLNLGADATEPEPLLQLSPLHLACWGRTQMNDTFGKEMVASSKNIYTFQEFCQRCGPPNHQILKLLLKKGADPNQIIPSGSLAGITPLHILCCWSPDGSSSSEAGSSSKQGQINDGWDDVDDDEMLSDPGVQQQRLCIDSLLTAGANANASTTINAESPLTFAAQCGAWSAVLAIADHPCVRDVCREVVVNRPRLLDGARPLDIALDQAVAKTALTLLMYGADPVPHGSHHASYQKLPYGEPKPELRPQMVLLNVIQCNEYPERVMLVQELLGRGAGIWLEEEWPESGETALLMAINCDDVECVELLVAAGADVNHAQGPMPPPVFVAAERGKTDMLKILLDAGADLSTYVHPATKYDIVQSAANNGHVEAVMALVEAGASWWLPKGQRSDNGTVLYVPEILSLERPGVKLSYVEGKLKLIEKQYKKRRETAEKALEPFLSGATPECKAATLAVAHQIGLSRTGSAVGRTVNAMAAAAAAVLGLDGGAAVDDVDALAAAIEGLGSSSSSGSSKKAKKKQKAKLQQQQQQQESSEQSGQGKQVIDEPAVTVAQAGQQQRQQQHDVADEQVERQPEHEDLYQQQQQVQPATEVVVDGGAVVDDIDALAAEIEALGSSSGSSRKAKKKQKARAQQQQQQTEQSGQRKQPMDMPAVAAAQATQQQQQQQQQQQDGQRAEPALQKPKQSNQHQQRQQQQQQDQPVVDHDQIAESESDPGSESEDELLGDVSLEDLQRFAGGQQGRKRHSSASKVYTAGDERLRRRSPAPPWQRVLQQLQQQAEGQQQQQQQQEQEEEEEEEEGDPSVDSAAADYVGAQVDVAAMLAEFNSQAEHTAHKQAVAAVKQPQGKQRRQQQQQQVQDMKAAQQVQTDSDKGLSSAAVQIEAAAAAAAAADGREGPQVTRGHSGVDPCGHKGSTPAAAAAAAVLSPLETTAGAPAAVEVLPAAAAAAPAAAMPNSTALPAAPVPSMLQNWRGSLNPIFMFNRPGAASGNSSSATAAAAGQPTAGAAAQLHAAAVPPALQPHQQPSNVVHALQQQQQQQQDGQLGSIRPVVPAAMMEALTAGAARTAASADSTPQQQQQQPDSRVEAGTAARKTKPANKCVVCMERKCDVLLLPCKHIVLCATCADDLNERGALKECPWCRASVVQKIKVLSP